VDGCDFEEWVRSRFVSVLCRLRMRCVLDVDMIWCICTKAVILWSGICVRMFPQSMYYAMRCVLYLDMN